MKTHANALIISAAACFVGAGTANAATISVNNFSFEEPAGNFSFGAPTGWSTAGLNGGTFNNASTLGAKSLWVDGADDYIYQDTGHVIQSGEEYTLTVDLRTDNTGGAWRIELYGSTGGETSPFASNLIASPAGGVWMMDQTVTYTAGAADSGQTLGIRLFYDVKNGQGRADNVRLEVVPEPGSLALLGLGALCVLRRRRG